MLRRPLTAAIATAALVVACSEKKTYDTTFTCTDRGGAACPNATTCPPVPLGSGGCEDLPGLFGHPPTKVDVGRPEGCLVGLSYGNPYFSEDQQRCTCERVNGAPPAWTCPI